MPQEADEKCHSTPGEELTFRLGEPFSELATWACENGLQEELEIIYLLLGLTPNIVGIANLVDEFDHPESQEILKDWAGHPYSDRLRRFTSSFLSNTKIKSHYAAISPDGTIEQVRRQYHDFEKRTFLLTLYTAVLSSSKEPSIYLERRRLRMWLAVQAAIRVVEDNNTADRAISRVARFLALGHDSPRWRFIDQLLSTAKRFRASTPENFNRFSDSLRLAVNQVGPSFEGDRAITPILNAISAIASGASDPYPETTQLPDQSRAFTKADPVKPIRYQSDEGTYDQVTGDSSEEEQSQPTWIISTDPSDSPEQQQLRSNSFFIQRVEDSHYLPWSYDGVLPTELPALEQWIDAALLSNDQTTAFCGATTWLACQLGRTLHFVQLLTITDEPGAEWGISPNFRLLHRRSPQRQNSWQPDEQTESLIEPFLQVIRLQIPNEVRKALLHGTNNLPIEGQQLGHIWATLSEDPLENWFNGICRDHFPRITSAKLGRIAGLRAFQATGDHNFSRLTTSPPNSGLPGACGYATWDINTIEQGLALSAHKENGATSKPNVMGSLLAPLEAVIKKEITAATQQLRDSLSTGDWLSFHNQFTQYCVLALYAATGCRHLRDPFESLSHFNWEYRFVYINDKTDDGLHSGRLVPLPVLVCELIQAYILYLTHLANAILAIRPELSQNLSLLLEGKPCALPLFFQLDRNLKWHSMGDGDLPGLPLLHWPLPSNVFRHRYAQQLARAGVSNEVIDGWMGHAERGAATYSDYSPRCWKTDAEHFQGVLNELFNALPFEVAPFKQLKPDFSDLTPMTSGYVEPTQFGLAQRRRQRSQNIKRAIREAKQDIALKTQITALEAMTAEDMDKLVQSMLFGGGTTPHAYAGIRLQVLIKASDRAGPAARQAIRRRVVSARPERSLITADIPCQMDKLKPIETWAKKVRRKYNKTQLSKQKALVIGTALLSIEKRISYVAMLEDLARGLHFHIVQHKHYYFLEYSETLTPGDFTTPIQRHEISHKVASLLCYGLGIKSSPNLETIACPPEMQELADILVMESAEQPSVASLLSRLARCVEQTNLVLLPGMVAGALSDRQPPTSLPLQDFLRIRYKQKIKLPAPETEVPSTKDFFSLRLNQGRLVEDDKLHLQAQAKSLYSAIQHLLSLYTKAQHAESAKAIEKLCSNYEGKVSTTVLMLGHWLAHMIRRGYGRRKGSKPYALNTLETYFSRLNKPFVALAYNIDLMACDEAEMTEFYNKILAYHRQRESDPVYAGKRLLEFHSWASEFGVEDPDWDDIDLESAGRHVRAGVLSEVDYLACLHYLENGRWGSDDERLFLGFLLFLTYRFGLRRKEALGLYRRDVCQRANQIWLLVRNNKIRQLKSLAGRRAVPLLFTLTAEEEDLIEKVLARYDSLAGNDHSKPILSEIRDDKLQLTSLAEQLPQQLIKLMREVTGNQGLVLHHCRHSFYNRLAPALLEYDSPLSQAISGSLSANQIRETALGEQHDTTRRSGMALARLVGHSLPGIGLKNYNHLMTDWADTLTPIKSQRARIIEGAFHTDDFEPYTAKASVIQPISFESPSLYSVLQLMRLRSLGVGLEKAGQSLNFHPDDILKIKMAIDTANHHMRFKLKGEANQWVEGKNTEITIFDYITDTAWRRILDWAKNDSNSICGEEAPRLPLNELPHLISSNRQLHMSHEPHCKLILKVLEALKIGADQYGIVVRDDTTSIHAILEKSGFKPAHPQDSRIQIDPFRVHIGDLRQRYGALIFKRSKSGIIRNRNELTVCFLAYGLTTYFLGN